MSTTLLYGLILVGGNILLTLVGYFLGYQTDKINDSTWFGLATFLFSVVMLWLGIRAVRDEQAAKGLSFGQGVGTGMLIALYAGFIGAIYIYLHFTFINLSFPDHLIEASRIKWAAMNMPESAMEKAEQSIRAFTKPLIQAVAGFGFSLVSSLIISLITAAFLRQGPIQPAKPV